MGPEQAERNSFETDSADEKEVHYRPGFGYGSNALVNITDSSESEYEK